MVAVLVMVLSTPSMRTQLPAGNWVLIEGVDRTITKTATITQLSGCEDVSRTRVAGEGEASTFLVV